MNNKTQTAPAFTAKAPRTTEKLSPVTDFDNLLKDAQSAGLNLTALSKAQTAYMNAGKTALERTLKFANELKRADSWFRSEAGKMYFSLKGLKVNVSDFADALGINVKHYYKLLQVAGTTEAELQSFYEDAQINGTGRDMEKLIKFKRESAKESAPESPAKESAPAVPLQNYEVITLAITDSAGKKHKATITGKDEFKTDISPEKLSEAINKLSARIKGLLTGESAKPRPASKTKRKQDKHEAALLFAESGEAERLLSATIDDDDDDN